MIEKVTPKNKDRFLALCAADDCAGIRLETAFACYENHPSVCGFYLANDSLAVMLSGKSMLCCGRLDESAELAGFAAFCRVVKAEGAPPLAGFAQSAAVVMRRRKGSPLPALKERKITFSPQLWQLKDIGLAEDADAFYADACLRLRSGAVIAAAEREGEYLATAGVYALRADSCYLTGVYTRPQQRGKGYAKAVTAALCRKFADRDIYLRCRPDLQGFYEALGFLPLRTEHDQIKKEEDTIEKH